MKIDKFWNNYKKDVVYFKIERDAKKKGDQEVNTIFPLIFCYK